ncbi:ABC transporter substrate-binding protein [Motiliproteus sp. SC1-56]|uniref:substrate-binding periplasmic protein n=1 Tax=Motiliproteus sp. SC1-56 TaxID=2799565 RepID=UPI001A8E224B|nr:transporter substrate-binding domain-containing protein [Motiliproteus sp. SC1-56]
MSRSRNIKARPGRAGAAWLLWLLALAGCVQGAEPVRLVAAELAPYAYEEAGQVSGLGVAIMREAARRLGHNGDVDLMPFKRAYQNARQGHHLLMTPVARIAAREGEVQWALRYVDDVFFYVSRAGSAPLNHERARHGASIAVLAGSAPLAVLRAGGVENFSEQTRDIANINLLRVGRVDGWFTSALLLSAAFAENPELDPADFIIGEPVSRHCVYIVASNDTPEAALRPWQSAFEAMQADGTYQTILDRFLAPELRRLIAVSTPISQDCGYL